MSAQADLFGVPAIPGLRTADAMIGATEEAALIALIDAESPSPFRFQG